MASFSFDTFKVENDKASTSKSVKSSEKPAKSSENRLTKPSTDARFEELNQKWSDQFNRLEVLLLAKTLNLLAPTLLY